MSLDPLLDRSDPLALDGYTYGDTNPIFNADPTGMKLDPGWGGPGEASRPLTEPAKAGDPLGSVGRGTSGAAPAISGGPSVVTYLNTHYPSNGGSAGGGGSTRSAPEKHGWTHWGVWHTAATVGAGVAATVAVTAGVVGVCSTGVGCVILAGVAGGAAAGSASYGTSVALGDDAFSVGGLATNTGVGAATGALGGGLGVLAARSVGAAGAIGALESSAGREGAIASTATRVCNCFPAGTPVQTEQGAKPIEQVQVGDKVWAKDVDTGKAELRTVTGLFDKPTDELIDLDVDGTTFQVTPDHPFWVEGKGWTEAGDLHVGDHLANRHGSDATIRSLTRHEAHTKVYNFQVDGDEDYYVTDAQLLVHNCALPIPGAANAGGDLSQILMRSPRQLQRKFKHAGDFGVEGNYSRANAAKFSEAIHQHINAAGTRAIEGTYRGEAVTHYLDPTTGLDVISSGGEFVSGWKLSPYQLANVLRDGSLGIG